MDGTTVGVLIENVGWKSASDAPKYVGVRAPAARAGTKRSRETELIEADALPLSDQFHVRIQRSGGLAEVEPARD